MGRHSCLYRTIHTGNESIDNDYSVMRVILKGVTADFHITHAALFTGLVVNMIQYWHCPAIPFGQSTSFESFDCVLSANEP